MPIGRTPNLDKPDVKNIIVQAASVGEVGGLPAGSAIALVDVSGDLKYLLCGALVATQYANRFFGFVKDTTAVSGSPLITIGRGSTVTPVREGSLSFTIGNACYLSITAGQVTQTPPVVAGSRLLKVGFAVSTTQMVLVPDQQIEMA